MDKIYFAKLKEDATIPSKREEDGDYDVYACFEENSKVIPAHNTVTIPTGIMSAFSDKYKIALEERGSTGIRGMAIRAGEIDSGFRGEWFVAINNTNEKDIIIHKHVIKPIETSEYLFYPYSKAICQAGLVEVPKVEVIEKSPEELKAMKSKRGEGCLGDSGK